MKSSPAVSLLLTNLRLLDYGHDADHDFPITPDIFISLTNKGKAFEYIIHHLFHTFDPAECDLRLQECWPVYEPAQSRELRNIIFKWLNDLKKEGRLGGVLVRRTTLEDCAGERYEELLLALSTMVLRDRIEKGVFSAISQNPAYSQATSLTPSPVLLSTLILAHHSSLSRLLQTRSHSKARWSSLSSFLNVKEEAAASLAQRIVDFAAEEKPINRPRGYQDEVRNKWRNNWLGDQRWLDVMLDGDSEITRDHFLEMPFKNAAASHQRSQHDSWTSGSKSVSLKGLERQVEEQKRRVGELKKLREKAMTSAEVVPNQRTPTELENEQAPENQGLKVEFKRHRALHLGAIDNGLRNTRLDADEYTELLDSLREELAIAGAPRRRIRDKPAVPAFSIGLYQSLESPLGISEDAQSTTKSIEEPDISYITQDDGASLTDHEIPHVTSEPPTPTTLLQDADYNASDIEKSSTKRSQRIREYEEDSEVYSASNSPSSGRGFLDGDFSHVAVAPTPPMSRAPESITPKMDKSNKKFPVRNSLGFGDDELLAEQIVSSIAGASFSPEKPSPVKRNYYPPQLSPIDSSPIGPSFGIDESSQGDLSRSSRQSSNHLATPVHVEPRRSATPTEDLLTSGDYNSVFKSRPKIATSPVVSPLGPSVSFSHASPDADLSDDDNEFSFSAIPFSALPSSPLTRRHSSRNQ